ncbi:SAM-dependent methyltransferase (plasmid) [Paroceanicella profunda]|uniref:SAM-dependent methyltransferase n=1 Tax=Paroceanicella profunda TaxID=2579971 RepID=A0A5B8G1Z8_9RHOB|nr:SAM-dependent methyltransferase [Paroceanicella profunda]QDL94084.1 SAM-dependent methyltransferase [Paroceanicella profunda]
MDTPDSGLREGEAAVTLPGEPADAALRFIGRIRTPWRERAACPRRGDPEAGPPCRLELDPLWEPALEGLAPGDAVQVLYWMHEARRDLVSQVPRHSGRRTGTFALRSPVRPNPIASSVARILAIDGPVVTLRGLDCLDGTPLLDLKPDHGAAT